MTTLHFHEIETRHTAKHMEACRQEHDAIVDGRPMAADGTLGLALGVCGLCEKPSDDLLERGFGLKVCLSCRRTERQRYEAATGRCARGCEYAPAFHTSLDQCPTESEARAIGGDR